MAFPSPRPSVPCPYVAGMLQLEANTPRGILDLIQEQLAYNAPSSSVELRVWASPQNQTPIYIGAAGFNSGPLTVSNYAAQLTAQGGERVYRSTYPGGAGFGQIQVLSEAPAKLHVELME